MLGLQRLFQRKNSISKFLESRKRIIELKERIERDRKLLMELEYDALVENKHDVFISLSDFLDLVNAPNVSLQDIILKCKHRAELASDVVALEVNVYSDNKHIIICLDKDTCKDHQKAVSNVMKLVVLR